MDKKMFLEEMLKMLAYADLYFKSRSFIAFYNSALAITFLCI